jgi:hypothetical protein
VAKRTGLQLVPWSLLSLLGHLPLSLLSPAVEGILIAVGLTLSDGPQEDFLVPFGNPMAVVAHVNRTQRRETLRWLPARIAPHLIRVVVKRLADHLDSTSNHRVSP